MNTIVASEIRLPDLFLNFPSFLGGKPPGMQALPGLSSEKPSFRPGYPLESPALPWKALAISAYTMTGLIVFKDDVLPQRFMTFVHSIVGDHGVLFNFMLGAVAIHVGYAAYVALTARQRKYDAQATAWWAAMSFAFGFLGVKMFLDKE